MTESDVVVDASAVIALLQGESLGRFEPERMVGAWISAVNLAEVLTKLRSTGLALDEAARAATLLDLRTVPFDAGLAERAADLWESTRRAGLSLGDRACLATAQALQAPAITADRVWAKLALGVKVILIR